MSLTKVFTAAKFAYCVKGDTYLVNNKLAAYAAEGRVNHAYSYFWFSQANVNELKAINDNQNTTVDKIEIWLPKYDGINARCVVGQMQLGASRLTLSQASTSGHRPMGTDFDFLNPITITSPGYNISEDGIWYEITSAMYLNIFTGQQGFIFGYNSSSAPSQTLFYYTAETAPQIRVTYHYHNSELTLDASSAAFGSTITANLTTYLSTYTHKLEYKLNDSAKTTVTLAAGTTSHTFTVPNAWMNQIPNATSALITATLTTYDGSTVVGDQSVQNVTATVPASVVPSPGSISYTVSNPLAVPITNKSLVAALSGQSGVYSSTIKSYTLQCEGYTSQNGSLTVETITRVPGSATRTLAITATVLDSRGRSASTTLNVTVYEWDVPYFSALEYYRCNSYGTKSEDGRYLRIACTYACYPVTVGNTNKNSITAHTYKIVTKDGSTTIAQGTLSGSTQVVGGGNLGPDEEYYLQLTLTDGVETIVYQYNLYSSAYVIHFRNGGTGVAFGQAADANNTVKINPNWVLIIGNNIDVGAKLANLESRIAALE